MPTPSSRASVLALGIGLGGGLGALAGFAESLVAPLETWTRTLFVIGADGVLGAAWGLLAGILLGSRLAPAEPGARVRPLVSLLSFPVLAAGLGLFVNRVLLSGTHFLSPLSLLADAGALVVAVGASLLVGRLAGTLLSKSAFTQRPVLPASILLAGLIAGFALPGRFPPAHAPDVDLPDIIVVSIDTLRPDRLSVGGDPRGTSPAIDRLCRQGVFFSEALAVSPGSAASHAALLTSRYPVSSGVWSNFTVMDESVLTLAEFLKERGYRTGGFATNTFLGKRFGFEQGFDTYVESGVVERLREPSRAAMTRSLALVQIVDRVRARFQLGYDPSFETAFAWLEESRGPAFWFVHIMDVHSPYVPPPPFGEIYGATAAGTPDSKTRNRFGWRPSEEAYLAEIRFADTKIRRLERALRSRGAFDRSILLLTSDHGENLLDHEPHFSHGSTLYDATVRILASVRAPAHGAVSKVDPIPLENVDLLPTVAGLLGWPAHEDWEGQDAGQPREDRVRYAQLYRDFAARTSTWKVILEEDGPRTYYRLDEDPGERQAVVADPERIDLTEQALAAWTEPRATELYLEKAQMISTEELSPETLEKLRALGYVE